MKQRSFDHASSAFAQSTQRQFAELNKALRALRDNTVSIRRGLHVPVPHGGRRYTKSVRTSPSVFEKAGESSIGNFLSRSFLSDVGLSSNGSFYPSSSQTASQLMQAMQQGQRVS